MSYRSYQTSLHPTALRGPAGTAWAEGLGGAKDAVLARSKDAVKAGFVDIAPADALPRHGADVQIARIPGESDAAYRGRLVGAWESWSWVGTAYGYAYGLSLLGLRGTRSVAQYQWSVVPDGLTSLWARFWVFVGIGAITLGAFTIGPWAVLGDPASPWSLLLVGSFTIGDGSTVGSTATPAEITAVRRTLAAWQNARDRVQRVCLADGAVIGLVVIGAFTIGGSLVCWARDVLVGSFTIGARPEDDPTGPWFPYLGRNPLV